MAWHVEQTLLQYDGYMLQHHSRGILAGHWWEECAAEHLLICW